MSIKNTAVSVILGLMFLSLLTIYMITAPSPLITFLSVLIMLVGLIMAQSNSWRDIGILAAISVIVSMVAIALVASARLGSVGTLIALLLWGLLLFALFSSARRTIVLLPRDRAILIRNLFTGQVHLADGPIMASSLPIVERVVATIPLYTLSADVNVEKVNTKRMNVDLIDVQVRYKLKDPQRALGGIPNLSQAQKEVAKDLGKDISDARLDVIFWEQLLNRQMRLDIDDIVREVIYDNVFAQNPVEVQGRRADLIETVRDQLKHRINYWGGEIIALNIDRIEVSSEVRKTIMKAAGRLDETELKEIEAQRDATRIRHVLGAEVEAEAERVRAIVTALRESGVEITPDLIVKAITATSDWQMEGDFSLLAQQPPSAEKK
jgi:regulator of protease activity HflC (stomatin/prohibitin superfamily)